ncbi:MAG: hypothetical protein KDE22_15375, partial [Rhodobacterales bacterium]|nr:hypothetical protein [Rhodobacterales bacterium]
GGRLETVLENLRFIAGLRRAGIIQTFEISMIYQALNLDQIPAFVALGRELGCDSIVLSRLLNWGTYGSADYLARAVHFPHHPDHEAYKAIINDPALMGPDLNHDFDPEFLDDPTPPATGPEPFPVALP